MPDEIDIGHGVTISFFVRKDGARAGLIETHPGKDGSPCSGAVRFRLDPGEPESGPTWVVVSEEPLTLAPSILCRTCGHHGFIRDGRWEPA